MFKPKIFIGSSKESIHIAKLVCYELESFCECVIWTDKFFEINQSTYANLAKKAIAFDFAVFIGGKDDIVLRESNNSIKTSPRDNVYLEFGLYAGILSPARTFFLVDENCKIASDLQGITLKIYSSIEDVSECCKEILDYIDKENKLNRIQLLPSTSLAIGYFENFLVEASKTLFKTNELVVGNEKYNLKKYNKSIKVCIPGTLEPDWKTQADIFSSKYKLHKVVLDGDFRSIGVMIDTKSLQEKNEVAVIDFPQTIRAAFKTVDLISGKETIGENEYIFFAKQKEIRNFVNALENLIQTNAYTKELVKIWHFKQTE